jgi:hypothetical protein
MAAPIAGTHVVGRVYPPSPQLETTLPLRFDVMPLNVVDTVQEEPLTVRVEDRPPCENIPSGWQTQEESPASSMLEQHVCAPLPLPPLLLLHAATSPTNRTTQADVIRFIDPDPLSMDSPASHLSAILGRCEQGVRTAGQRYVPTAGDRQRDRRTWRHELQSPHATAGRDEHHSPGSDFFAP